MNDWLFGPGVHVVLRRLAVDAPAEAEAELGAALHDRELALELEVAIAPGLGMAISATLPEPGSAPAASSTPFSMRQPLKPSCCQCFF